MYSTLEEELDKKIQKASDWNIKLLKSLELLEMHSDQKLTPS